MPITVNTNMSSLICQRSLNKATNGMNTALQRMSTGLRINSSKDDAAGMAISSKMDAKLSSYSVAQDNVQMGSSMLDTASGSIDTMTSMLQRMRDLSEQAANGTYGAEERKAMQAEVDALTSEIYRIKNTTEFNGKKILGEETASGKSIPDTLMSKINVDAITQSEWNNYYKGSVIGISNADDLAKIATLTNDRHIDTSGTTFALTGDIDLSSIANWTAIGNEINQFQGNFNGNGYKIENLKINKSGLSFQGLFGAVNNATIQNVDLIDADISGDTHCGILAGDISFTTIDNCKSSGKVTSMGISNNCYSGGLIGSIVNGSTVSNSSTDATVEGSNHILGGLSGSLQNSTIVNCSSGGTVTQSVDGKKHTGGLVGYSLVGTITNSYSTSTVSGKINVGGLVGYNAVQLGKSSTIQNSYSTGKVSGTSSLGGLVGLQDVTASTISSYYDTQTSGQTTSAGGAGKTTGEMKTASIYAGWDTSIWNIKDGEYPTLKTVNNINENSAPNTKCNLQVGINNDLNSVIEIDTGFKLGEFKINLQSEAGALSAIDNLDKLLSTVSYKSLEIGATQNRLSSTKEFQGIQMNALTSASSLIKDADIAKESASYIKNQILQQTTATLLATANQNPSIALSLM